MCLFDPFCMSKNIFFGVNQRKRYWFGFASRKQQEDASAAAQAIEGPKGKIDHLMIRRNSQFGYVKRNYKDLYWFIFLYLMITWFEYMIYSTRTLIWYHSLDTHSHVQSWLFRGSESDSHVFCKQGSFQVTGDIPYIPDCTKSFWIKGWFCSYIDTVVLHAKIRWLSSH